MDRVSKSIAKNIQTGDYFKDAMHWYTHKYLRPALQRSYLFVFTMFFLSIVILVIGSIDMLLPMTQEIGFVTRVKDSLGKVTIVHSLEGKEDETADRMLARYMLKSYVHKREEYSYSNIAAQNIYVSNTSSKPVAKQFTEAMDTNNPESLQRLYQWQYSRLIAIERVDFIGRDDTPERAVVAFSAILKDNEGNIAQQNRYLANIVFTIPSVQSMMAGAAPMEFQVKAYHVKQLE
jgi:type IV secretory pathway component VirB8